MDTGVKDLNKIAEGGYSKVYEIKDSDKILKRLIKDVKQTGLGSLRELSILKKVGDYPAISGLHSVHFEIKSRRCLSPVNNRHLTDDTMHFVFDKADTSLRDYLYENRDKVEEEEYKRNVKRFMVQILLGLEHLHKMKIIHRDMKPENVLIYKEDEDYHAMVTDLGMAEPYCSCDNSNVDIFGSWYRPPEICYGINKYDYACDIWNTGLMFAEMVNGSNLLEDVDDDDDSHIMTQYLQRLPPLENEKNECRKLADMGTKVLTLRNKDKKRHKDMASFLNTSDSYLINLISKMLRYDPSKRISVTAALEHPYFKEYDEFIKTYRQCALRRKRTYEIVNCFERRQAFKLINEVLEKRKYIKWFTYRILFQAASIFDRAISHKMKTVKANTIESEERGKIWTLKETQLYFYFCLYIAYKYFFIDGGAITLKNFIEPLSDFKIREKEIDLFLKFEKDFLVSQDYDIYFNTLFEKTVNKGQQVEEKEVTSLVKKYYELQDGPI